MCACVQCMCAAVVRGRAPPRAEAPSPRICRVLCCQLAAGMLRSGLPFMQDVAFCDALRPPCTLLHRAVVLGVCLGPLGAATVAQGCH